MLRPLVIAAAVPFLAVPAIAQPVTRAALEARLAAEFKASDRNKDGALTLPEIQRRTANMRLGQVKAGTPQAEILAKLWFARADADKNGKISQTEYGRLFFATFDRYDTDKDGRISPAERAAAERSVVQGPPGR